MFEKLVLELLLVNLLSRFELALDFLLVCLPELGLFVLVFILPSYFPGFGYLLAVFG